MFVQDLIDMNTSSRITQLTDIETRPAIRGDFEGSVTGTWVKLDLDGTGLVSYNNKTYKTRVLGIASVPAGTYVELSHADGVYYSKF